MVGGAENDAGEKEGHVHCGTQSSTMALCDPGWFGIEWQLRKWVSYCQVGFYAAKGTCGNRALNTKGTWVPPT